MYFIFCPRTRPKTFLQCFALEQRKYKAKHCRNDEKISYFPPPLDGQKTSLFQFGQKEKRLVSGQLVCRTSEILILKQHKTQNFYPDL